MDHIGGLSYIIRKFDVKEAWTNGRPRDLPFYQVFSEALEEKGLRPKVISSEAPPMEIDGCRLFFLNPPAINPFEEEELNDQSIVLRLVCPDLGGRGFSLLLTGDIERGGERRLLESGTDLKSTVLKVPHHGSISSLDLLFLSAVSPEAALFSVGQKQSIPASASRCARRLSGPSRRGLSDRSRRRRRDRDRLGGMAIEALSREPDTKNPLAFFPSDSRVGEFKKGALAVLGETRRNRRFVLE
ncbi:MAG: MBL fold metallo-hydrolase [Candidatus Manganitrophus sp.]|nr:MBL fold metallo-hydrolase [Candidatus Manganitrophus sp.]